MVEDAVIVELKSVDQLTKHNKMQLLSYLRLAKLQAGLLINLNVEVLREGVVRIVSDFKE